MWNNPDGLAAARRMNTGGFGAWGDEIWDTMCFLGCHGQHFTQAAVIETFIKTCQPAITYDTARRYVGAFFAYVLATPQSEFSGPASRLVRCPRRTYVLLDNPEPADAVQ